MSLSPLPPQPVLPGAASAPVKRGPKPKVTAERWFIAALEQLALGGIDAVRIEVLAEQLGVTKGMFYARFDTREVFLDAMVDYWRQRTTTGLIAELSAMDSGPEDRLARLFAISRLDRTQTGAWVEVAMRSWALTDKRAKRALEEIDRHRLAYFESLLTANGVPKEQVPARAFMIYSYVIGDTLLSGDRAVIRSVCQTFLTAP
ncbi:TetR/AcrR family transcriptional regulator [Sphingomonas koreensis]|uniref:TetR/AcrR family transcriptional regulator n=1 Tax=Sphingomonas koreensis TaxID=93064 RepID=UPI000830E4F2|nr:TetR/AcrR family transcriptional regulator [Sphingomonas koreensis]PJI88820.1 TetR family transcriptional regulator [Sphingomonas koreensis]RSU63575.1 TetR/AcrR family transcriptional regulator [Sphingomonas koreensis]RSU69215.1 TetR/AcrR family transcriptional regulator [Sphingomonas koreensis]